jgi:hypothetical protein
LRSGNVRAKRSSRKVNKLSSKPLENASLEEDESTKISVLLEIWLTRNDHEPCFPSLGVNNPKNEFIFVGKKIAHLKHQKTESKASNYHF